MSAAGWLSVVCGGVRMWQCPDCGKRVVAFRVGSDICPYDFCPFCLHRREARAE